jgi:hypothetical protein
MDGESGVASLRKCGGTRPTDLDPRPLPHLEPPPLLSLHLRRPRTFVGFHAPAR